MPRNPTPAQIRALEAYIEAGSGKKAAQRLGIRHQTLKNTLEALYMRLNVNSIMEAAVSLGYVNEAKTNNKDNQR